MRFWYNSLLTGLYWARVDHSLLLLQTLGDGVFCHYSLSGTGVRGHEHALIALDGMHRHLLEGVQSELVFACRFLGRDMVRNGYVRVSRRHRDLVSHLQAVLEQIVVRTPYED